MIYIEIQGVKFHKELPKWFTFNEFKEKHPKIQQPEKVYKQLGGTISKPKKAKKSDSED